MNEWLIALLSGMIVALIATIIIWFLIQKNHQDREKWKQIANDNFLREKIVFLILFERHVIKLKKIEKNI